jgi:hypothetical protein
MIKSITERRKIARKARAHGYFRNATTQETWVRCPECGKNVVCTDYRYGTIKGQFQRLTIIQQLDAGMLVHLDGYCGEES